MGKNINEVIDVNEIESINALIDKLNESSFDFLKLENENISILISKNGLSGEVEGGVTKTEPSKKVSSEAISYVQSEVVENETVTEEVQKVSTLKNEVQEDIQFEIIKSPSHGLFYAQSSPGEPPYVIVGAMVEKGQTVGLLEIMKVYSSIEAPANGEVVEIYVQDNEVVAIEQPLMKIKIK